MKKKKKKKKREAGVTCISYRSRTDTDDDVFALFFSRRVDLLTYRVLSVAGEKPGGFARENRRTGSGVT